LTGPGFEEAASELAKLIEVSVEAAVAGKRTVAVAFSGGLDSSVLAALAKRHAEVVACSAFSSTAGDALRAKGAAQALGVRFAGTTMTKEMVAQELEEMKLPFEATLMDRALWCLYSVVARKARDEGAEVILLGQMADELFGGYSKYEEALRSGGEEAAGAMMMSDVNEYPRRGRARDYAACARWVQPRFPMEAKEVVEFGLALPVSFKIRDGIRKAILRRAAVVLGVPEELAGAPKKAAQYSSGVQRLVAGSRF
jgi:asparagine synthase (glutamine-hydrolysing)